MVLTEKQKLGLELAIARYKSHKPYTCIACLAGTGKSTLVKFIVAALDLNPKEDVAYVAFTGKAANVLSRKGNPNAITAHKLLYEAKPKSDGSFFFMKKFPFEKPYKLIVVDEVSMLPKHMWELLLDHHVHILACGDPGQLPPLYPEDENHVLDNPHIFLDEIMRQAEGSEIIQFSRHVREGKPTSNFQAQAAQVQIFDKANLSIGMYNWADQIICATNNTRIAVNQAIRNNLGYSDSPQEGDKIITMRNHWDISSDKYSPLTNGTTGYLKNIRYDKLWVPYYISNAKIPVIYADIETEYEGTFKNLTIDLTALLTGTKFLNPRQEYQMNQSKKCADAPIELAYGYAITCHRAQGSEWDKVLVLEEKFPFDKDEHKRWLYTAATRASDKLVVINK